MGDGESNCWIFGGVVFGIGLLLIVILIPLSFSDVEYYQVRLLRKI